MARAIYEIKLKESYFPALDVADALELRANGDFKNSPADDEFEVHMVVKEEDTMKLFFFTKTINFGTGVTIMLMGVRMLIAEIVPAFQGIE